MIALNEFLSEEEEQNMKLFKRTSLRQISFDLINELQALDEDKDCPSFSEDPKKYVYVMMEAMDLAFDLGSEGVACVSSFAPRQPTAAA